MNKNVKRLCELAGKPDRNIIGLMSGTSLDGLDIAFCTISGNGMDSKVALRHFKTVPYSAELKEEIRMVFAKQTIDLEHLTLLNPWLGILHGKWVLEALEEWGISASAVDLIASHGQTIYHSPKIYNEKRKYGNATLQIGDGDHLSVTTGIITVSDFRQKHIAAGGEGAPLALYGDYLLFSKSGESRLLLNMGGIANFTFLPGSLDPRQVLVTDTGPGNTLIDAFARQYFGMVFDQDAGLALKGKVIDVLLNVLKEHPFFTLPLPKTTGPELFNLEYLESAQQKSGTQTADLHDIIATLTKFSAETIAIGIEEILKQHPVDTIFISGGGANNPLLVSFIAESFPKIKMARTDELGIDGDAKEAVLFAVLANEAVAGNAFHFGDRKGMPAVTMGKISFPD